MALASQQPVRVLHLEDSRLDAELVAGALADSPRTFAIDRVWSGADFSAALISRRFDLILADYTLPAFDGDAALTLAREHAADTPFIFVSGTLGEDVAVEALKRGATDYVVKQGLHRLPRAVERALAEAAERSAHRRTQRLLAASEARYRQIVESARDFAIVTLDSAGAITSWSAGAQRLFGLAPDEAVGRPFAILYPDDGRGGEAPPAVLASAMAEGRADHERWYLRRDGRAFWGVGLLVPLMGESDDAPAGFLLVLQDRTRQREAEAELRLSEERYRALNESLERRITVALAERQQAEDALRQSQKLETIGQLTGGVAHDFNNLLTPIVGALEILRLKHANDPTAVRFAAAGLQAAARAKLLVDRLLAFARRQALAPRPVDVRRLIEGMRDLIERSIGPTITVRAEMSDVPPARVDPNQLELAILNLVVNARDAMPDGGSLGIAVGPDRLEAGQQPGLDAGDYVRIRVTDTGVGMDGETLDRAIEPFFTTKTLGLGTGLGLSMVHGLAAQLGGGMEIRSRPGAGTTIVLWLPAITDPVEAAAAHAAESRTREAPKATSDPDVPCDILLVDDEALVREVVAGMLRGAGYRVHEASSPQEAEAMVDAGLAMDMLVTDQLMPGGVGSDLAATLRRRRPGLPVLLISGYANDVDPGLPRLAKPFGADELTARVRALLAARPAG